MGMFKDVFNTMSGKDLDDESRIEKTGKKADKASKKSNSKDSNTKENRKDVATEEAKFAAYDYANDKDQLSKDIRAALREGCLSADLSKLLQVLFDRKAVRELVSAQGDVCPPPPGPDEYYLEHRFIHPDSGDWCNEEAEALMNAGKTVEELKAFNMELKVVRKRKLDDEEIQEGTDKDYEEIKQKLSSADTN